MKYNLLAATSIVIANMIGTGVFTSLGFQLLDIQNMNSILLLWILGGVIAILGSFCYSELSAAFPGSGGEYHFLRLAFNDSIGFLSGWTSAIVGFAAPIAASAYAFAIYFSKTLNISIPTPVLSISVVLLITMIHTFRLQIGSGFQVIFTAGKLLLLAIFIIAGIYHHQHHPLTHPMMNPTGIWFDLNQPGFWIGLIFVAYSYSGWNASAYIIDDIENSKKNVPRSILIGTLLVTSLYVAINYIFLLSAPAEEMKGKEDVAHVAAQYIFGSTGAVIVSGIISFFLISTISSMIIVGPRVIKRIAADHKEFTYFSHNNAKGIPVRSILLQSCIAILFLLTGSFAFIITSIGLVLSIFTSLTAIGLIILRKKHPEMDRPVKTPFYPLTPILFCIFNFWTIGYLINSRPAEVVTCVCFLALGLLIYLFLKMKKNNKKGILALLIGSTLFVSCQSDSDKNHKSAETVIQQGDSAQTIHPTGFTSNEQLNQRAMALSGLDSIPFSEKTRKYLPVFNKNWNAKNERVMIPINHWMKEKKWTEFKSPGNVVFYPFSGPDFDFAAAYYPEADKYILCGLEPAGSDSSYMLNPTLPAEDFFLKLEKYFYFSDRFGFFRTLDMEEQFEKRGVLDIISFYLKRHQADLGEIKRMYWNKQTGELGEVQKDKPSNACYFKFRFPSGRISELYYFSKDLSNDGLASDSSWLRWVEHQSDQKNLMSLTKSASYLMHTSYFSTVRNFILKYSKLHIQDDTGIPYSEISHSGRSCQIFGEYTKVIPIFSQYYQKNLFEQYQKNKPEKLPFRIGYNLRHNETNLQVIR